MRPAGGDPREIEAQLWDGWLPGALGWDVGANCGQSFVHMLKLFERVVAFEAAAESHSYLTAMWAHETRVTSLHLAVSSEDGTVELAALPRQMETGQLVSPGTMGMEWEPESWDDAPLRTIPARSCDSLTEDHGFPDFVTVDTEGHEARVMAGARGLLERGQTDWLIEFHTPENQVECQRALEAASHAVEIVRHPHYPEGSRMWFQHGWIRAMAPGRDYR